MNKNNQSVEVLYKMWCAVRPDDSTEQDTFIAGYRRAVEDMFREGPSNVALRLNRSSESEEKK